MNGSCYVRFNCRRCGNCCTSSGRAYLHTADLQRLPASLGLSLEEFAREYCEFRRENLIFTDGTLVQEVLAVKKQSNDHCAFYDGRGCMVHAAKPRQCALWPFLGPIMRKKALWEYYSELCDGLKQDGRVSYNDVVQSVDEFDRIRSDYLDWLKAHDGSLEKALGIKLGAPLEVTLRIDMTLAVYTGADPRLVEEAFVGEQDEALGVVAAAAD